MMTADLIDLPECRDCGASMPRDSESDVCDYCQALDKCADSIIAGHWNTKLGLIEILDSFAGKIRNL